jgi:iron complex outermembrane recepter protein
MRGSNFIAALMAGVYMVALAPSAQAQQQAYNIPAGSLKSALDAYSRQTRRPIIYKAEDIRAARSPGFARTGTDDNALAALLAGTGFASRADVSGAIAIIKVPQSPQLESTQAGNTRVSEEIQIDEITITATRRNTSIQGTPLTISALSAEALTNRGIRSIRDIAYAVPGLSFVSDNDGSENLSVRGIVAFGSTATTSRYLDETPISQQGGGTFSPRYFDIERVEVLRGPQGTLYGASSMGGAVRIITKKPNLTNIEGSIRAEGSTTRLAKGNAVIDGAISLPIISDRLALRVTGFYETNSGWVKNFRPAFSANPANYVDLGQDGLPNNGITDPAALGYDPLNRNDDISGVAYAGLASNVGKRVGGEVTYGGRAALGAKLGDAISLTASYAWQKRKNEGFNNADNSISLGLDGKDFRQARVNDEFSTLRSQLVNFTAEADFGIAKITSSTSYEWNRENSLVDATATFLGNVVNSLGGIPQDDARRVGVDLATSVQTKNFLTQEVRVVSTDSGAFNWIVGGFYNRTRLRSIESVRVFGLSAALAGSPLDGAAPNDSFGAATTYNPRREISFFGELGYKFSDNLSATVGIRRYNVDSGNESGITGIISNGVASVPLLTVNDKGLTYKALLNYKPIDDILLFVGYTTGYRPGGVNPPKLVESDDFPQGFKSDKLAQYELGWKTRLLGRKLTFNGALFYIDWKDIPARNVTSSGVFFTFNGPAARTYGAEAEIMARPTKGMDFSFGVTVLDAKFNNSFTAQGITKGDSIPEVPKYTLNAAFNYEWLIGGETMARVNANIAHVSSRGQFASQAISALPGFVTAGLSVGATFGKFDLSIFARNIFDERAVIGNSPSGTEISDGIASSVSRVSYIRPRTVGASVQFLF